MVVGVQFCGDEPCVAQVTCDSSTTVLTAAPPHKASSASVVGIIKTSCITDDPIGVACLTTICYTRTLLYRLKYIATEMNLRVYTVYSMFLGILTDDVRTRITHECKGAVDETTEGEAPTEVSDEAAHRDRLAAAIYR